MVTDEQVRRLRKLSKSEKNQEVAASKAGMDPKTAREYLRDPRLPSERKEDRKWRTRADSFTRGWEEVREQIDANPGLEAKTLFEALQHPNHWKADGNGGQCGKRRVSDGVRVGEKLQSFLHRLFLADFAEGVGATVTTVPV